MIDPCSTHAPTVDSATRRPRLGLTYPHLSLRMEAEHSEHVQIIHPPRLVVDAKKSSAPPTIGLWARDTEADMVRTPQRSRHRGKQVQDFIHSAKRVTDAEDAIQLVHTGLRVRVPSGPRGKDNEEVRETPCSTGSSFGRGSSSQDKQMRRCIPRTRKRCATSTSDAYTEHASVSKARPGAAR